MKSSKKQPSKSKLEQAETTTEEIVESVPEAIPESEKNTESYFLKRVIEGALFSAGKPLTAQELQKVFQEQQKPSLGEIRKGIQVLEKEYALKGVMLKEVASGWRFQVAQDVAQVITTVTEEKPQRQSRAFLETLALIAYRQPITRAEIEDVRGVQVSPNIIKHLLELEWIRVVGHKDVPGKPELFATTKDFLDHFSLKSLEELPPLTQLRDIDAIARELEEKELSMLSDPDTNQSEEMVENESHLANETPLKREEFSEIVMTAPQTDSNNEIESGAN